MAEQHKKRGYPYSRQPRPNDSWPEDAVSHQLEFAPGRIGRFTSDRRHVAILWVGEEPAPGAKFGHCFGSTSNRRALRAFAKAILADLDALTQRRKARRAS